MNLESVLQSKSEREKKYCVLIHICVYIYIYTHIHTHIYEI